MLPGDSVEKIKHVGKVRMVRKVERCESYRCEILEGVKG